VLQAPKYEETPGSDPENESDDTDDDEFVPTAQHPKEQVSQRPGKSQEAKNTAKKTAEEKAKLVAAALVILKITDNDMIEWNTIVHLPMKGDHPVHGKKSLSGSSWPIDYREDAS